MSQPKILLVEDEAIIALAEAATLKRGGYSVAIAPTGERAIELVERGEPVDLVLMDIDLGGGMDGTQTAQVLLSKRDMPVIFLSSHTEPEVVALTDKITSYGYVVKNSGETVLFASIKMAFRLYEAKNALILREARLGEALAEKERVEEALEKRLVALTRPIESGFEDLAFEDLFNVDEVQKIQDAFASATGVASIITNPEGKPITKPSNFCRLCEELVRGTPRGIMNCEHSDAVLGASNPGGPIVQRCLSAGLYDGGTSISVGRRPIANWLIGQVLDEDDDEVELLRYAGEIDVDSEEYRRALSEVTRMPKARFEAVAEALFLVAQQLSRLALQNVQQAQYITHLSGAVPAEKPEGAGARADRWADSASLPLSGAAEALPIPASPEAPGSDESWMLRFRELQHRIKNSLSIIDALIGFQVDASGEPGRSGLEALRGRVASIARLYDLLYRVPAGGALRLDEYLGEIAESIRLRSSSEVVCEFEPLEAAPGRAVSVGLILNEALVNAFKYAGNDLAAIRVGLKAEGALAWLSVEDDGPGFDPALFQERSSDASKGIALMGLLAEQLGGEARVESVPGRGTKVSVSFPLC
jgi:two-component sensor histidine kinase